MRPHAPRNTGQSLEDRLSAMDGGPYPAYRDLRGSFAIGPGVAIEFLHVQPDPYAPPSRLRARLDREWTGVPVPGPTTRHERVAIEDFLARALHRALAARDAEEARRSVRIDPPAQQILERSALTVRDGEVEVLLEVDLPARGRRIEGRRAARVLAHELPRILERSIGRGAVDSSALCSHVRAMDDYRALRGIVSDRGWIAFAADGSRIARRSGDDDAPLEQGSVPLVAPEGLAAFVDLPHAGRVRGLAIPRGITLLCGGGFHGKSTLLRSLGAAVYPHVPGDGRERIASDPTTLGARAEDGRAVTAVDLRPFLHDLPGGVDPAAFSTANASGATSQAAAIIEAMAMGCRVLLIDEDTSATNFLLRDRWMADLLRWEQEPITPLLSRMREMLEHAEVSTVLVVGGSGEAFRVADRALLMDAYHPLDATARVAGIRLHMGESSAVAPARWPSHERTIPLDARPWDGARVRALGPRRLLVGDAELDLGASGALVHPSQARTLATILQAWLRQAARPGGAGGLRLPDAPRDAARRIAAEGPLAFAPHPRGDLAEVREQEIAMLANRLRVRESTRR